SQPLAIDCSSLSIGHQPIIGLWSSITHSALGLAGAAGSVLGFLGPLGSRLAASSSGVIVDSTPSAGTSILEIQSTAFRTVLRKLSSPQFRWGCAPVKPKPRPPSGR